MAKRFRYLALTILIPVNLICVLFSLAQINIGLCLIIGVWIALLLKRQYRLVIYFQIWLSVSCFYFKLLTLRTVNIAGDSKSLLVLMFSCVMLLLFLGSSRNLYHSYLSLLLTIVYCLVMVEVPTRFNLIIYLVIITSLAVIYCLLAMGKKWWNLFIFPLNLLVLSLLIVPDSASLTISFSFSFLLWIIWDEMVLTILITVKKIEVIIKKSKLKTIIFSIASGLMLFTSLLGLVITQAKWQLYFLPIIALVLGMTFLKYSDGQLAYCLYDCLLFFLLANLNELNQVAWLGNLFIICLILQQISLIHNTKDYLVGMQLVYLAICISAVSSSSLNIFQLLVSLLVIIGMILGLKYLSKLGLFLIPVFDVILVFTLPLEAKWALSIFLARTIFVVWDSILIISLIYYRNKKTQQIS